jgi:Tfp pilus assembly protein PilN
LIRSEFVNRGNLIPTARRAIRVRRRLLRQWIIVSVCYALLLVISAVAISWIGGSEAVDPAIAAQVRNEISRSTARLASFHSQAAGLDRELALAQKISDQPDWSILLAAIAKQCGDEITLAGCDLSEPREVSANDPSSVILGVHGVGRSNDAVANFVLRLEGVPILERVKLLQTTRKQVFGLDAFSFDVTCSVVARKAQHE